MHRPSIIEKCKVVIIGAGMAGLGAAQALFASQCEDVIILEAQEEPGGRIKTVPLDDGFVDLGAQWIHGTQNALHAFSEHHGLIAQETSQEGLGIYVRDDGFVFDEFLVKSVDYEIGKILMDCEKFVDSLDYPSSLGHYLEEKFFAGIQETGDVFNMRLELFDWHTRFQIIDNACHNLKELSAREWGKYCCLGGDEGQAHINLKNGYKSLVDALLSMFPNDALRCNSAAVKINWQNDDLTVICSNGIINCKHVIVTASLGVLKASNLFEPSLPRNYSKTINSMGYFNIGKIFLIFEYKWWESEGFQLVWRRDAPMLDEVDKWIKHISGFDLVFNHPEILVGWIGGDGVVAMENLPEEEVGIKCVCLLRRFLRNETIPFPKRVITTKWTSSPWIKGGYSHITPQCDRLNVGPTTLCEPIARKGIPKIVFAGEGCHPCHFSTTHGAFESGQSQARKLIKFLK